MVVKYGGGNLFPLSYPLGSSMMKLYDVKILYNNKIPENVYEQIFKDVFLYDESSIKELLSFMKYNSTTESLIVTVKQIAEQRVHDAHTIAAGSGHRLEIQWDPFTANN